MCLEIVLKGKEKKAALAELKETVVVWKVLLKPDFSVKCYRTDCQMFPVFAGEVKFKQARIPLGGYRSGGHFWLTKTGAKDWCSWGYEKIVRCIVKKSDINAVGFQNGHAVVVVKKATFPKYIGKKKETQ